MTNTNAFIFIAAVTLFTLFGVLVFVSGIVPACTNPLQSKGGRWWNSKDVDWWQTCCGVFIACVGLLVIHDLDAYVQFGMFVGALGVIVLLLWGIKFLLSPSESVALAEQGYEESKDA